MFDGVLGSASDGGNLGVREVVDVEEDEFLKNIDKYINNSFDKAQNDCRGYNVRTAVQ